MFFIMGVGVKRTVWKTSESLTQSLDTLQRGVQWVVGAVDGGSII